MKDRDAGARAADPAWVLPGPHAGDEPGPTGCWLVPSAFITQTTLPSWTMRPTDLTKAIWVPSGDQVGAVAAPRFVSTFREAAPTSGSIVQISDPPLMRQL